MSTTRTWTEPDLMALPKDGRKRELVDGEIRVTTASLLHGHVIMQLGWRLGHFLSQNDLGWAFGDSLGCWMPSGNLRVPDCVFVAKEKLPRGLEPGFLRVPPDLVVEVLSPGDSERAVLDKVGEYLQAGVRLAWVIDPEARRASVHRSLTSVRAIGEDDWLEGEDVLPGFRCLLRDVLP